jgi:cyclic pyranopterin monophosphate synthase
MVDTSSMPVVKRTAVASAAIKMKHETVRLLRAHTLPKGDALACSRIAGITAAKKASELIPLCHNVPLDDIDLDFYVGGDKVTITASVVTRSVTGVEMEALTAASIAALTIYDMCKSVDATMAIGPVYICAKVKENP